MSSAERRRRLLMTADAVGGVWTYAVELCQELDSRGYDVTVAVMGPAPSADQLAETGGLTGVTVTSRPFLLEWMDDPWDDVTRAGDWLLELEQTLRPDVIHLNGYCHASVPFEAPSVVVGHSCVLSWWQAVHGEPAPAQWNRYHSEVASGLRCASAVVAPSATMLRWLAQFYGPLPRSRVVLNGRRAELAVRAVKEPLILAAGRIWDEAKNVASLCRVAPHLPWPVAIAGPRAQTGCDPHTENVQFLGRLAARDLQRWMARASIYALPARYEPFGLSALEAALAGCALVLGGIPTLREIWGDAAVYVDPESPAELHDALVTLAADAPRRAALAARASARARSLTPGRMADEYCDLYSELMGERRSLLSLSAV